MRLDPTLSLRLASILMISSLASLLPAQSSLLLKDILPGSSSSLPARFVDVSGTCFFQAGDGVNGHALWKTDGTPQGTVMVYDFFPGSGGGVQPRELVDLDGLLVCFADDGIHGGELWASDGTAQGTYMVKDINPGNQGRPVYMDPPVNLTPWRAWLYFSARDGRHGRELMRTDGTAAGTTLVKDINPGNNYSDSHPSFFTPVGNQLFFFAYTASLGYELWVTDGSSSGTRLVKDIWPGPEPSLITHNQYQFVVGVLDERILLFAAPDGMTGFELWRSDGTAQGTTLVKDISPSGNTRYSRNFTQFGNRVYFSADDGVHGMELWTSDGTTAGTMLFKDIVPGSTGSDPGWMAVTQGGLLFTANDGSSGHELWISDGTSNGTRRLMDLKPGSGSSVQYTRFYEVGSRYVYFAADDGRSGAELWRSDGTIGGTTRVQDIAPGYSTSYPEYMTLSGGQIIFRAKDASYGQEPRVFFPGATAQPIGRSVLPGTSSFGSEASTLRGEDPVLGSVSQLRGRANAISLPIVLWLGAPASPTSLPTGQVLYFDLLGPQMPVALISSTSRDWTQPLAIPADPALGGVQVMLQAFQLNSTVNGGLDSSNGLRLTLGL
jgi:ELWxxDGT repeat protein